MYLVLPIPRNFPSFFSPFCITIYIQISSLGLNFIGSCKNILKIRLMDVEGSKADILIYQASVFQDYGHKGLG